MENYQKLKVWQKSIEMSLAIYALTRGFPDTEKFGLVNQMRRCSVSIASNIAEGHARNSDRDFVRFLRIAYGSSAELETQMLIARRLEYISDTDFDRIGGELVQIRKMLNKFIGSLTTSVSES
jgi:four helix bundle protein